MIIPQFGAKTGRLIKEDNTIVNMADGINADGSVNITETPLLKSIQGKYFWTVGGRGVIICIIVYVVANILIHLD